MRVGIYGGTFDPVHNGHIIVATWMIEVARLDKLMVMPAYIPPHKIESERAEFSKRFEWLKKAFKGVEKVEISNFEGKKEGISYTFETVSHFEKIYGKLVYIMGEDNFLHLNEWYKYEELLKKIELWVYPRTCNFDAERVLKKFAFISNDIHVARDIPLIQISSTSVRDRVKKGLPLKGYVPECVEEEIKKTYAR